MRLAALILFASILAAGQTGPRLLYTKSFPGSVPEYVSITVSRSGQVVYKEAVDDPDAIQFQLSAPDAGVLFSLADTLDRFQRPIESGLKVARMGLKTFRYEDGKESHEVKFNYSQDQDASALAGCFEKIAETEQAWIALDRAIHFDKLGVNQAILEIEAIHDRHRLVSPSQFLPLLDRVANNDSFLHMARERAAKLAGEFRNPAPAAEKSAAQ